MRKVEMGKEAVGEVLKEQGGKDTEEKGGAVPVL